MLEAKPGYIITTNRTPRDLVTSKEIFFFKHSSIFLMVTMLIIYDEEW